jgi:8-oxo-dGTP pyrophosphatase MutT (NUDIX family)
MAREKPHIELIARAVFLRNGHLLACKNLKKNYYYLPGGHIEFNEPAAAALRRELLEEADLRIRVGPLLLATEGSFRAKTKVHHEVNLVFHVEHARRKPASSRPPVVKSREPEIGFEWLDSKQLARRDVRPAGLRRWLERWLRSDGLKCSTWNSEFKDKG